MKQLIIFGAAGFAEVCHYYFTRDSDYTVAAFTVDGAYAQETTFQGLPVVPFEEIALHFSPSQFEIFVALGIRQVNRFRAGKLEEVESRGYRVASFVSPRAIVPQNLSLAPNTMIMDSAIVMPSAQIGRDTIIWPQSGIGPHVRVGNHCWLVSPRIGETVEIGDYSFAGLGATIAPFVKVGQSNVIGAGALVLENTEDNMVFKGLGSKASKVPSNRLGKLLE